MVFFRAGIDGGGVFKEFLTSLSKEVFDTDRGLWLANKKNELYPNPHSYATERQFLLLYSLIDVFDHLFLSAQLELVSVYWTDAG